MCNLSSRASALALARHEVDPLQPARLGAGRAAATLAAGATLTTVRATTPPNLLDRRMVIPLAPVVTYGAVAFLALLWFLVAPVPFLSEDWTQMEQLSRVETLFAALDPAREPLRPLQHAFLWTLANSGFDLAGWLPAAARAVAFLLHGLAFWAVWQLARRADARLTAPIVALAFFAVYPNLKMLAWPAAIGSPGRTAFELVALLFLVRRHQDGRARDGWLGLAALAVALGFHETALLLPAILLAWIACVGTENIASGVRRAFAALRDPFVLAACAMGAAHLVHLLFFRPGRVHGAKDLSAIPANVVKAAFALAPEFVRDLGVEGFRGHGGAIGLVAASVAIAAVGVVAVVLLRRGGLARFAVLAIALDLGLAVAGAGFVQRYACLASAFLALALADWSRATKPALRTGLIVLALLWAADSLRDALEIRAAGRGALALAAEVQHLGGARAIAVVGVPDMIGAEEDVPYFNWGGTFFLRAHGVTAPVQLLRERAFRTNSDQGLVDRAHLDALRAAGVDVRRWAGFEVPLATYPP